MPSIAEIEQLAFALEPSQRASLASRLLSTLPDPGYWVSDEEVLARDRELQSGQVQAISHEEFIRSIREGRLR